MRALEFFEERMLVATVPDIIANVIGVLEGEHDNIMSASIAERARTGRLGFLVLGFAVNNGSRRLAGVFANSLPDAHHVSASGINDLAAAIFDLTLNGQFSAESRHDHHVFRPKIRNVRLLVFTGEIFYA